MITNEDCTILYGLIQSELATKLSCKSLLTIPLKINRNLKGALGRCRFKPRTKYVWIEISEPYLSTLTFDELEDTIRHEIAHGLDFLTRGKSGHDSVWKYKAMLCGARPERFASEEIETPDIYKFTIECKDCKSKSRYIKRTKLVRQLESNTKLTYRCSCGSKELRLIS